MTTDPVSDKPEVVAVFPLNVVLFPGGLLPLRIFEPRYLRMVSECMKTQSPFAVATIIEGTEAGDVALPSRTGTLARIIDWQEEDDGLLGLLCEGEQRCAIGELSVESDQLLRGLVTRLPAAAPRSIPAELQWAADVLGDLLGRLGEPYDRLRHTPPSADHVAGRLIEILPLPLAEKRALFELDDAVERLRRLGGLIQIVPGD